MAGPATAQGRAAAPDATASVAAAAPVAAITGATVTASDTGARVPLASRSLNATVAAPPAGGAAVAAPSRAPATRKAQMTVRFLNDLGCTWSTAGTARRRGAGSARPRRGPRAARRPVRGSGRTKNVSALAKAGRTLSLEGTVDGCHNGAAACAETHDTVMQLGVHQGAPAAHQGEKGRTRIARREERKRPRMRHGSSIHGARRGLRRIKTVRTGNWPASSTLVLRRGSTQVTKPSASVTTPELPTVCARAHLATVRARGAHVKLTVITAMMCDMAVRVWTKTSSAELVKDQPPGR